MNDLRKISILEDMAKHIPDVSISRCVGWANEIVSAEKETYILKTALALLGDALDMDSKGNFPKKLLKRFRHHKAGLWALHKVQYYHAWVVCGPTEKAMEKLIQETNSRLSGKSFFTAEFKKLNGEAPPKED